MYILNEMNEVDDIYSLEEVNCLEKPVGVMLNSFNPLYRHFYLLFEKMMQSYNFKYYSDINYNEMITMERSYHILKREMNIELHKIEDTANFFDIINQNLDKNNPVIVPGNLRELYYSNFYNKADWTHSFLVYEYDEDNGLYRVFDSTQRHDEAGHKLYKFVVPKDVLYKMFKSFNEHIYKEGIYYLSSKDIPCLVNCHDLLFKCVYEFCNFRKDNPYIELDFINQIMNSKKINQDDIKGFIQISHFKKVFFNELSELLKDELSDYDLFNKYSKLSKELIDKWFEIDGKIVYYLYKKNKEKINLEINKVIKIEEKMLGCMNEILSAISQAIIDETLVTEKNLLVNNSDNIISKTSDDEYLFDFNENKIYNNWFSDDSPKVIFNDSKINYDNVTIKVKFKLEKYIKGANFLFGVYLKDSTGSSYIFGGNSGVSMLFEHSKVNNSIWEKEEFSQDIYIIMKILNKKLDIMYILNNGSKVEVPSFLIKGEAVQLGVCCKTWGIPKKVCFTVKDIEVVSN